MTRTPRLLATGALCLAALGASAQTLPPPQNVLQLQASGTVEVQQDLLQMTLTTSRDGLDPAAVQAQLKTALDAALAEARRSAQPGQLTCAPATSRSTRATTATAASAAGPARPS
jgi:predicted secreted protein